MVDPVLALMVGVALASIGYVYGLHTAHCPHTKDPYHQRLDEQAKEVQRAKDHRTWHSHWNIPWGEEYCTHCKAGHERDRER